MLPFDKNLNENIEVHKGDVLLAEPFLEDQNFNRSVVLMCEHQNEGSFGLVFNKPAMVSIEESNEMLLSDNSIYVGGPVEQNTLHFIHKFDFLEGCIALKDGIYWSGNYEHLKALHAQGMVHAKTCRFFIGYSGWGNEQLKSELKQDSWVVAKTNLQMLFEVEPEKLWKNILRSMGKKYQILSNYPSDPRLN
ncbi:MAG: YqgE/AlgH family protein [Bacteroidota bacterium]